MTCPKCYTEFEAGPRACPECGLRLVRHLSGVIKTSSVMIAAGEERGFYRSVQDVPEPLRSRLIESTHSANSGTILIADKAGKDQLTQVIARRENAKDRHASNAGPPAADRNVPWHEFRQSSFLGISLMVWAGVVLFLAAISVIAAVFLIHW